MASKQIIAKIRVVIPAGGAKPAPPVGPALGQAGINIMSFCKDFNAKTSGLKDQIPVPTLITAYSDKSFTYETSAPPTSYLLKKAAALTLCSRKPGHENVGKVSLKHVYAIAEVKKQDFQMYMMSMQTICQQILGTAKAMGITVVKTTDEL